MTDGHATESRIDKKETIEEFIERAMADIYRSVECSAAEEVHNILRAVAKE